MITDSEFVMIKAFDLTLARNADDAQAIINHKNRRLVALADEVVRLRAALSVETGRRRLAELKLTQRRG